jgi:hypothetical protein
LLYFRFQISAEIENKNNKNATTVPGILLLGKEKIDGKNSTSSPDNIWIKRFILISIGFEKIEERLVSLLSGRVRRTHVASMPEKIMVSGLCLFSKTMRISRIKTKIPDGTPKNLSKNALMNLIQLVYNGFIKEVLHN